MFPPRNFVMLQQLASAAIIQGVEKIRSLRSIPDRVCFKLYQQIHSTSIWNLSLIRVLDSIELAADFAFINTHFASNSKALQALFSFYYKYSKNTIKKIIICNDKFIPLPRMPKIINNFSWFPVAESGCFQVGNCHENQKYSSYNQFLNIN